jgi:hypothetical protein
MQVQNIPKFLLVKKDNQLQRVNPEIFSFERHWKRVQCESIYAKKNLRYHI